MLMRLQITFFFDCRPKQQQQQQPLFSVFFMCVNATTDYIFSHCKPKQQNMCNAFLMSVCVCVCVCVYVCVCVCVCVCVFSQ